MIINQTTILIFEYPQDYLQEQEWCKTKEDRWVHKGTDTLGAVYENKISYSIGQPNNSEKPNNCEPKICDTCRYYNSNIPCGSTPSACKEADKFAEEFVDGLKKLKPKVEPQTNKDFKVTYTCSFTDCKNFGFNEKCIECKRKQKARLEDEPQTDCQWK